MSHAAPPTARSHRRPLHTVPDELVPPEDLRDAVLTHSQAEGGQAGADLVIRHWVRYATTAPAHLLAAVRALPGDVFADNAGMIVAANYLQYVVDGGSPQRFERDHFVADTSGAPGSLAEELILLTRTVTAERARGEYGRAVDAATEARRLLNQAPTADLAPLWRRLPHFFLQWGRALDLAATTGRAVAHEYEEAHRLALDTDQPQVARRAAGNIAWYYALRGQLTAARYWLDRVHESGRLDPRYDAVNHLTRALIHLDHREPEDAARELGLMAAHPIGDHWAAALWVRSRLASTAAEHALLASEMEREIDRHPAAVTNGGLPERFLRAAWMRLGRPVRSRPGSIPHDHAIDALREYQRGDFHRAIACADDAIRSDVTPRSRAAALLITAAAAHALGRTTVAHDHFDLAHALIERERILTTYELISPEHLAALSAATVGTHIPVPARPDSRADTSVLIGSLTKREREVLTLLPSPRPMTDIAAELTISPNTLKATARRLYRKLGVSSRTQAADLAHSAGLHVA